MVIINSCSAKTTTNYPVFMDIEQVLEKKTLDVRDCKFSLLSVYKVNCVHACGLKDLGFLSSGNSSRIRGGLMHRQKLSRDFKHLKISKLPPI